MNISIEVLLKVNFESVVFTFRKNLLLSISNYVALKVVEILKEVEQQVRVEE